MNKDGVFYKPETAAADVDNDADEVKSFSNGPPHEKKEFVYKKDSDSDGSMEPAIDDMPQPDCDIADMKTEAQDVSFHIFIFNFLVSVFIDFLM